MSDPISNAWEALNSLPQRSLAELFAREGDRVRALSGRIEWGVEEGSAGILFDWSKTHLDDDLIAGFEALADACGFAEARAKLLGGKVVNVTEGRAATHGAMRGVGDDADVEEGEALLARMGMLV
ncbi:MAG: glucose-6-phosphate isomerase, partial [Altererythrobacter ishigakiensis]|nr:glucose-6-phosphate isomerase [Altererythrobacter ishigakiensis]